MLLYVSVADVGPVMALLCILLGLGRRRHDHGSRLDRAIRPDNRALGDGLSLNEIIFFFEPKQLVLVLEEISRINALLLLYRLHLTSPFLSAYRLGGHDRRRVLSAE